ncbi:MAG: hypothetical protein O3A46_09190 [Candidatus Poribacteria bacterium]|nr:hypothetical protein [Candidatus Poribacteria bacterium]
MLDKTVRTDTLKRSVGAFAGTIVFLVILWVAETNPHTRFYTSVGVMAFLCGYLASELPRYVKEYSAAKRSESVDSQV